MDVNINTHVIINEVIHDNIWGLMGNNKRINNTKQK
jgi:hypothetical protein